MADWDVILARSTRVSRRLPCVGDVGVVKDLAIHEVDTSNYLVECIVKSVRASILFHLERGWDAFIEVN